jgi:cytoskeletal protein RodZ
MKNNPLKPTLLGLLLASAMIALPSMALAQAASAVPADPATPAQVNPDNKLTKNISGKVSSKTETSLTVDGRTVSLSSATTFSTKGGSAIGSADIRVGDNVNIVTSDDGQVAVSVDVAAQ